MATSCYSASDPPNPKTHRLPSSSSSLQQQQEADLCLYFGNVRVTVDNSNTTSPGSSSNVTPTKTQQSQSDFYPKYESGFGNSPRVPVALYSQSIWGGHSVNARGNFMGSNNLNVHQPMNLIGNPTEERTGANWSVGVGATSTSLGNWANQLNPFGNNNCNQIYGGQDYRTNVERTGLYYSNGNNWPQSSGMSSDIARLAMTQLGSQALLQRMMTPSDPLAKNMILEGVFASLFEVMCDCHGHYVFRKLVESCNYSQLRLIVAKITLNAESLVNISVRHYGSKSIQRLIKVLEKSPLIYSLTSALSCVVEELMTSRTGSYVILKCLNHLDIEKNKKIYEAAVRLCIRLAQHEKGCVYLNEFITYSKTPYREKLMDEISSKSKFLSQDPSGNYVVQHILTLHNPVFSAKICFELRNLYIQLSLQKGGSHVVEMCLNSSGMEVAVNAFLKYDKLWQVARDQYGNYVIQTALKATKRANSPLHQMLLEKLHEDRSELMCGFGRKVLSVIDKGVPLD